MRIIAGTRGGRRLKAPKASDTQTRPTLDRVRESLFNILGGQLSAQHVADLCAGTGALGLEALSRGAKRASFFERYAQNVRLIHSNIADLDFKSVARVVSGALPKSLSGESDPFDLVLFDPPYDSGIEESVLETLVVQKLLIPGARLVVEQDKRRDKLRLPLNLLEENERMIGDTRLSFLRYTP